MASTAAKYVILLSGGGPGIVYLLKDEFTTTAAAGAVNGTTADGTGQTRTVTDTNGILSIDAGGLLVNGSMVAYGNPGLYYPEMTRACGLAVGWRVTMTSGYWIVGADDNTATVPRDGIYFASGTLRAFYGGNQRAMLSGSYSTGVTYDCVVIARTDGMWALIKGGAFTEWTLGFVYNLGTFNYFPAATGSGALSTVASARRVYAARLTQWASQYSHATERKAITVDGDTITAAAGNALIEHTIISQAGVTQELMVRRTDDDNCVIIRMDHDAGTIKVIEKSGGVETEKTGGTTTHAWSNNTAHRIYVNLYGSTISVMVQASGRNDTTSSFNADATGVKVSHAGTDLIAWPVTPSAAAIAELNVFFPA